MNKNSFILYKVEPIFDELFKVYVNDLSYVFEFKNLSQLATSYNFSYKRLREYFKRRKRKLYINKWLFNESGLKYKQQYCIIKEYHS